MLDQVYSGNVRDTIESKNWNKIESIFKWLSLWVGYYIWIWEKYIIILFTVLDVRCDIFFENALIDFRVIIGIILLKVAILLDVVSIYKSCGRMRDGKRSCLFTYSTTDRKTYPTCFFSNIYEKVGYSISETPPFDIWQAKRSSEQGEPI